MLKSYKALDAKLGTRMSFLLLLMVMRLEVERGGRPIPIYPKVTRLFKSLQEASWEPHPKSAAPSEAAQEPPRGFLGASPLITHPLVRLLTRLQEASWEPHH